MSLRLRSTNTKTFKTRQKEITSGIPYLVWEEYPEELAIDLEKDLGKRVWVAGTAKTEVWHIREIHIKGSPGYPEGGLSVYSKKEGKADIFLDEAILHPKQK